MFVTECEWTAIKHGCQRRTVSDGNISAEVVYDSGINRVYMKPCGGDMMEVIKLVNQNHLYGVKWHYDI